MQQQPGASENAEFQPTLPARGATSHPLTGQNRAVAISTHAPRTGSDADPSNLGYPLCISTHAPRTGSDSFFLVETCAP